jgi:hypothetical protein
MSGSGSSKIIGDASMRNLLSVAGAILLSTTAYAGDITILSDSFSDTARTNYIWQKFCTPVVHKFADLGKANRQGFCRRGYEDGRYFYRIRTYPFDIRVPVDWPKGSGGSEIAGNPAVSYWDPMGTDYPGALLDYEGDFRIVDLSLLQRGLVKHAAIWQFHSQDTTPCGVKFVASSPSPGLDVQMADDTHIRISIYIKPIYKYLSPDILKMVDRSDACDQRPDSPCNMTIWRGVFTVSDVMKKWMHVKFSIKWDQQNGALGIALGIPGLTGDLAYQQLTFKNGQQMLTVPTTVNKCPYMPHLGSYSQGYNQDYYGTLVQGDENSRLENGLDWVSPKFSTEYHQYITGEVLPPPRIIVDYREFRKSR